MKSGSKLNAILTNGGKNQRNDKNSKFRQLEALRIFFFLLKTIILPSLMELCEKMWEKIGFVRVNYAFKFKKLKNTLKIQK